MKILQPFQKQGQRITTRQELGREIINISPKINASHSCWNHKVKRPVRTLILDLVSAELNKIYKTGLVVSRYNHAEMVYIIPFNYNRKHGISKTRKTCPLIQC